MTTTITNADKQTREEFTKKFNDKDFCAIKHRLIFEVVEFIPMKEFNKKTVTAENYEKEKTEYIKQHSTNLYEQMQSFNKEISKLGLYVEIMSQKAKEYLPFEGLSSWLKELKPKELIKVLEELTPPPKC